MFDSIMGFFGQIFIKIASQLPTLPYSLQGYLTELDDYMGYINYFIPFYKLSAIFSAWSIFFVNTVAVIMVLVWAKNLMGR